MFTHQIYHTRGLQARDEVFGCCRRFYGIRSVDRLVRAERRLANLISDNMVVCARQRPHFLKAFGENPSESRSTHLCDSFELCDTGDLWMHIPGIKDG